MIVLGVLISGMSILIAQMALFEASKAISDARKAADDIITQNCATPPKKPIYERNGKWGAGIQSQPITRSIYKA